MKAFLVKRSNSDENTYQIELIDERGRTQRLDKLFVLGSLRVSGKYLKHHGAVLLESRRLVVYLDPGQVEWLVRRYVFESSLAAFQSMLDAERVQLVTEAWQRGREWYSFEELQQIAAQMSGAAEVTL